MKCIPESFEVKTIWLLVGFVVMILMPFFNYLSIQDNHRQLEDAAYQRELLIYYQLEISKAQTSLFLLTSRRNVVDDKLFELEVSSRNDTSYRILKERYSKERERIQTRIAERKAEIEQLYTKLKPLDFSKEIKLLSAPDSPGTEKKTMP